VQDDVMTVQAIAGFQTEVSGLRRGACPTLGRPMRTGDGLLARLRPADCRLTLAQLRAVALAAAEHGNGILEVTARGSLQIRGLRPETVAPFEQVVLAAGIVPTSGVMVEVPPLAGIDPAELIDPRPIAEDIRTLVEAHEPMLSLAPKLAITVDGGGRFHLGAVTADIRLTAICENLFLLALGGTNRSARKVAVVERKQAASAVLQVLEAIALMGPAARGKHVDSETLGALFDPAASSIVLPHENQTFLGVQNHGLVSETAAPALVTVGLALSYRQARAGDLMAFLDEVEILGLSDIRLAPGHGLILTGLHPHEAIEAAETARRSGFWTSPAEPRANISLCAGTVGCASAHFDTQALAEEVVRKAPELLDGSLTLHLSGCPKGCAHPAPSPLTITGAPSGYGLVVNGAASDAPALYIAANDLGIALQRLASLVAGAKETGETISDCLERLGPARIAAALKLDGQ
jgi:precorrin-3B synthase